MSTCFTVLRQIGSIRRSVPRSVLQTLVSSLVLSRLDYGNATLAGIPQYLLCRIQPVMNSAARLIFFESRYCHITPLLRRLHWLKAQERIDFKLAVLVYKSFNGSDHSTSSMNSLVSLDNSAHRRLCSASSSMLDVRRTDCSTVGDQLLSVTGPRVWNTLLLHVVSAPTLRLFRNRLKTHLISSSFP